MKKITNVLFSDSGELEEENGRLVIKATSQ